MRIILTHFSSFLSISYPSFCQLLPVATYHPLGEPYFSEPRLKIRFHHPCPTPSSWPDCIFVSPGLGYDKRVEKAWSILYFSRWKFFKKNIVKNLTCQHLSHPSLSIFLELWDMTWEKSVFFNFFNGSRSVHTGSRDSLIILFHFILVPFCYFIICHSIWLTMIFYFVLFEYFICHFIVLSFAILFDSPWLFNLLLFDYFICHFIILFLCHFSIF